MLIFASAMMTPLLMEGLRKHAERRLQFATDRFDRNIRNVNVRLADTNGPRGGIDKLCRVTATLRSGLVLYAEDRSQNFFESINRATRRLRTQLAKHQEKRHE